MKKPFPYEKPMFRTNTNNITVVFKNNDKMEIVLKKLLYWPYETKDVDVNFILNNFDKIEDPCKSLAAQFLVSNGVSIELIPEYRCEEYLFELVKKIKYNCGCIDIISSYEKSFDKPPENFKKVSEFGNWDFIRYYGEEIHTEENSNEFCQRCSSCSLDKVLKNINNEYGYFSNITIGDKTYVVVEYEHFLKNPITRRAVVVLDHNNLSMKIIKRFVRFPKGESMKIRILKSIINCISLEELPKAIGITEDIDSIIKERLEKCR